MSDGSGWFSDKGCFAGESSTNLQIIICNEKLQIIHRFSNAQTKEQIKETYISLTNEFAKGQTVKDGSMLNESVQNKVGKVHRTDNAIVTEKNLMNENDETNRFKQLLNYNFNKKK